MDLRRFGLINTRLKTTYRILTLLTQGWVFGLTKTDKSALARSFFNPATDEVSGIKFPSAQFERLKKGRYITRTRNEWWQINNRGHLLYLQYADAAHSKEIAVPVMITTRPVVNPHTQLGRPIGHRGGFWDRGFAAGLAEANPVCPYNQDTKQSRGFALIWHAGKMRARSEQLGS